MIRGAPYRETEDTKKIVEMIANLKGLNLSAKDFKCVRAIKRGRVQKDQTHPPNIIVTFHDEQDKRDFRTMTELTAKDIDPDTPDDEDHKIFINENLPPKTRTLLWQARSHKRRNGWRYTWTEDGVVYIRKKDEDEKIQINELADLERERDSIQPMGQEHRDEEEKNQK